MANELNIALAKSGLTVTAQRYQSGAAVGSAISCPETGSSGFYSGNMTGTAGTYQVAFISASANVGSGSIVWSGTAEVPASTFNAASDTVANVTLCATTTTLTNAPTVPTAIAIASQVRTELATELARVDVATSSRLATSGYTVPTTPPTAAANATAVRTELATELARVDVATSSRLATSGYTAPTTPPTVTAIRQELDTNSTKLANLDATVSSRLASSVSTNITAIKAKTDLLNTDRLGQVATTSIVGNLIAQSNS